MASFLRAVLLSVAVGVALGVAGQTGSDLHPGMRWVVALGVPWLATAFAAGAIVGDRNRGRAALAGAIALVVGTLAYYTLRVALGGGGPLGSRVVLLQGTAVVACWCAASVCAGAVFGFAGALWRRGSSASNVVATALLSGALVGEALLLTQEWSGRGARLVLGAELAVGALAPLLLTRRRALIVPALALTVVFALVAGIAEDGVRHALRDVGWRGA